MKKSRIMAAAAAAVMAMSFAACGGNTEQTASDETTAANGAEVSESAAEGESAADGTDESLQKVLDSGKFILGLDATF